MRSLYPGYTMPRLFRNGQFFFNTQLHSGAQVEGRTVSFPASDPHLAIVHYSYDSISHCLEKQNRYTDGEALNLWEAEQPFDWRMMVREFVRDAKWYYDARQAPLDEGHGLIYALLGGFYRFISHAKLYERRYHEGKLQPAERVVPPRLEDVLEYALQLTRQQSPPTPKPLQIKADGVAANVQGKGATEATSLVWSGPLLSPSGYGEQSRHHVFGFQEAALPLAAQIVPWSGGEVDLEASEWQTLADLEERVVAVGFTQICHAFPPHFARHPQAGMCIGRTVFETDRLPAPWVKACNRMDAVWVSSEFNRQTFAAAGVAGDKMNVFPESLCPRDFEGLAPSPLLEALRPRGEFVFLSVFDWTLHKGWDALIEGFLRAFEGRSDVALALKVWSSLGQSAAPIQEQAGAWAKQHLGHDLAGDRRIHFLTQRLTRREVRELYQGADAYVLPSRGEGWGRPYMEAMACGKPAIATNWGGNTHFMTPENSYLLDYTLQGIPEAGWKEVPLYQGHRWAEPDLAHLVQTLRRVVAEPQEARPKGAHARQEVLSSLDRVVVARQMAREIARLEEERRHHPHGLVLPGDRLLPDGPVLSATSRPFGVTAESGQSEFQKEALKTTESASPVVAIPVTSAVAEGTPPFAASPPFRVRWEGAQFVWHSFAHSNREWCMALLESGQVDLSLISSEGTHFSADEDPRFSRLEQRFFAPLSGPAETHVRHSFPPRLEPPPAEGHFVLMQPWEYGYLPEAWIEPIRRDVDEVWCNTRYVRQIFLDSGIPEERLHLAPLGANTAILHPHALPHIFTDEAGAQVFSRGKGDRFVFLFLGGTLERKGIDILLEAYQRAFSAYDEVCLVIKDSGTQTVYAGQNARDQILSLVSDASRPPIVYLDAELSDHQVAGIYTACDCYVHPYRGEGFCMPVLEAMTCGLPVIVPAGGPTDDFVDESVGWRVPAHRKPFGVGPGGRGRIGAYDCVGPTWMFEVDVEVLARQMRDVFQHREEAKKRGGAAARRVQEGWTWHHSAQAVLARLEALREQEPRRQMKPGRERQNHQKEGGQVAQKGDGVAHGDGAASATPDAAVAMPAAPSPAAPSPAAPGPIVPSPASTKRPLPTLSLCMIVRNEERVLDACLSSAKPWFDEIIMVDTGSTDATIEIAQRYGVRLFHFSWCDDFSAARNESLRHATGDWVFWMDADDTLPSESGHRLRDLAFLAEERTTGFIAQVHIPPPAGQTGFTIVDHVKLFRNRPELRFEGRIHEQILEPIHRSGGRVERSEVYVVHSGYDYSPAGQQHKRERDLRLLEKDLADRPGHPFVLFNIGMTAYHMRDFPKARQALLRCLEVSRPRESTIRKVYAMLAGCALEERNMEEALRWVEQGLSLYPRDPELLFRGGIIYREVKDLERAEQCYLTLLTAREVGHIDSLDVTMTGYKAHHNLALIYQDKGDVAQAEAHFRQATTLQPSFVPSWQGLVEIYRRTRRAEELRHTENMLQHLTGSAGPGLPSSDTSAQENERGSPPSK